MVLSTPSPSTHAPNTVSDLTGIQATKPLEEETTSSTPSSVTPGLTLEMMHSTPSDGEEEMMLSTPSASISAMLASSVETDSAILSEEELAFYRGLLPRRGGGPQGAVSTQVSVDFPRMTHEDPGPRPQVSVDLSRMTHEEREERKNRLAWSILDMIIARYGEAEKDTEQ